MSCSVSPTKQGISKATHCDSGEVATLVFLLKAFKYTSGSSSGLIFYTFIAGVVPRPGPSAQELLPPLVID